MSLSFPWCRGGGAHKRPLTVTCIPLVSHPLSFAPLSLIVSAALPLVGHRILRCDAHSRLPHRTVVISCLHPTVVSSAQHQGLGVRIPGCEPAQGRANEQRASRSQWHGRGARAQHGRHAHDAVGTSTVHAYITKPDLSYRLLRYPVKTVAPLVSSEGIQNHTGALTLGYFISHVHSQRTWKKI